MRRITVNSSVIITTAEDIDKEEADRLVYDIEQILNKQFLQRIYLSELEDKVRVSSKIRSCFLRFHFREVI